MVHRIYPAELQLNKANASDTEAAFLDLTYRFFFLFLIQFNVPFKNISLIETSQSVGGAKREYPGKPPDTPASRTWLVTHVASAGLKPTPDTAVR